MREFTNPTYDGACKCCKPRIQDAIKLLADNNLVWSSDFERIRPHLLELLTIVDSKLSKTARNLIQQELDTLVHILTDDEFDQIIRG